MKIAKYLLVLGVLIFSQMLSAAAEDITFEALVGANRVSLGDAFDLNLTFYGTNNASAPELPAIDDFDTRYIGPSSQISIINGRTSMSVSHLYSLLPKKEGAFTIPSLRVNYGGKTYTSRPITIEVVSGPAAQFSAPQSQDQSAGETPDLSDRIFVIIESGKIKAYQNELIPIKVKLYINNLAVRDIQYPSFSGGAFSIGDFGEPRQYRETLGGILYDVIEFDTRISASMSGVLTLGPASLKCNLIIQNRNRQKSMFDEDFFGSDTFNDFFGRYQTHPLNLASNETPIIILALPEDGKPAGFTGVIGQYDFQLDADPKEVKVGDPITLKMSLSGARNFKALMPPEFKGGDDFKVYEPETKQEAATKIFSEVIIPKNDKIKEVPAINFSFFNPETGKYQTITKGPIPIKVNPLPKEEALKVYENPSQAGAERMGVKEVLGRDIIYIKESPGNLRPKSGPLCENIYFIAIQAISAVFLIVIFFYDREKNRLASDVRYARRLRASRKARKSLITLEKFLAVKKGPEFFNEAFKALQEYIGGKFHLSSAAITVNIVDDVLRAKGIEPGILDKVKLLFAECDMARYAPSEITSEKMKEVYTLLVGVIDALERARL